MPLGAILGFSAAAAGGGACAAAGGGGGLPSLLGGGLGALGAGIQGFKTPKKDGTTRNPISIGGKPNTNNPTWPINIDLSRIYGSIGPIIPHATQAASDALSQRSNSSQQNQQNDQSNQNGRRRRGQDALRMAAQGRGSLGASTPFKDLHKPMIDTSFLPSFGENKGKFTNSRFV